MGNLLSFLFGNRSKDDRSSPVLTRAEYKEKLRAFNATDKYRSELAFLTMLLNPQHKENILDFGCGLGTAMRHIEANSGARVFGYDVHPDYYEGDPFKFRQRIAFEIDSVYFMHSIAHIPDPLHELEKLRINRVRRLTIITPNYDWLCEHRDTDYVPDPTVHCHYTGASLAALVADSGWKVEQVGQFGPITNGFNERVFLTAKA